MKVYLSAPFEKKAEMADVRVKLHKLGVECSSQWLDEQEVYTCDGNHWQAIAKRDIADVADARACIFDVTTKSPRGGMDIEFGLAVAMGKTIITVGAPRSHFHYLADYNCGSMDAALGVVAMLRQQESQ